MDYSISLIENLNEINFKKINLIPAENKKVLLNNNIDLFINIASFQEMTKDQIKNYFDIISSNKAMLYCCNREYKKLPNGDEIYFKDYPFQNSKTIFFDDCKWYKYYYSLRFPFIHTYKDHRGIFKHKLSDFSKV